MKKSTMITTALLCSILTYAQQSTADTKGFIQLPGGVEYKMAHDEPGTTVPGIGDYVETHMYVVVDGNMIYNSREINGAKPVSFVIQKSATKTDIQEVIKLMSAGDSAVIMFSVDSLLKTGVEQLSWMKPKTGQKATYMVKVLTVKPMGKKKEEGTDKGKRPDPHE